MPNPIYSRVVHVRAVSDIFDTLPLVDKFKQTVAIAVKKDRRNRYAELCTLRGAERCTPVGQAHSMPIGSPWDGFFNCSKMVRWVVNYNEDDEQTRENRILRE
jgi:hypothetical protein